MKSWRAALWKGLFIISSLSGQALLVVSSQVSTFLLKRVANCGLSTAYAYLTDDMMDSIDIDESSCVVVAVHLEK